MNALTATATKLGVTIGYGSEVVALSFDDRNCEADIRRDGNVERVAAKATHWAFYILMVLVPLSGWTYVSSQWADGKPLNVPTLWFGLFQVPQFTSPDKVAASAYEDRHILFAYVLLALIVVHVAAALWHHYRKRDRVLARMVDGEAG